jgi:uncharacterized protein (TIGR02391 family)
LVLMSGTPFLGSGTTDLERWERTVHEPALVPLLGVSSIDDYLGIQGMYFRQSPMIRGSFSSADIDLGAVTVRSDRDATLTELAEEAAALNEVPYDSPKVGLWKERARHFVSQEFGEGYLKILNRALRFPQASRGPTDSARMHHSAMDKAMTFLLELHGSEPLADETTSTAEALLTLDELHPRIVAECATLFRSGHHTEAVEKSFKVVRGRLRELTGFDTGSEAFGKGGLRVRGAIDEYVEDDFNEAVKFLTMAIDRFRNEKAHALDARVSEPVRAVEYLAMSSLALRLLDRAYIRPD